MTHPGPDVERAINAHLARRHGVISRDEALGCGMTTRQVQGRLERGLWVPVHRAVYARGGVEPTPEGRTLAACLAAGPDAVASHRSAAWLWGLLDEPPPAPNITVPVGRRARLDGVVVHRRRHPGRASQPRQGVPVTAVLRTVVDLAAVCPPPELDAAVDVALARRHLRLDQLLRVLEHPGPLGHLGLPALRVALRRRGFVGAPTPSVLESRTLRLLAAWGYPPLRCEVVVCDGRYRVDFLMRDDKVLEVDGFAFHSSPEAKARDSHRRNALRAAGMTVIESDWVTVTDRPDLLRAELEAALGPPTGRRRLERGRL